ncbi:MAG: glycosyltransferase, partial [Gammaproteobacteria bacterium]
LVVLAGGHGVAAHGVLAYPPAVTEAMVRTIVAGRAGVSALAREHGVQDIVRFAGRQPQNELKWFYGAADVFVLATAFEGWANVFLEAMACGLPVVTTRVGGNAEVIVDRSLGELVDWWNAAVFRDAIDRALRADWDRNAIIAHARANTWDERIERLIEELRDSSVA